ncbi:transposase [Corynebacterium diphtheriae bv. mitis]|nr:transposase [Corynebacterium diphtheriae bv. mitis]
MSTPSALPSTESLRLPAPLVTPMAMPWLRTSTSPHKNEIIHTRTWNDVVDVEIATFEWVTWWNESRLHQSLGYRTPAEVEAEFWEHHPSQGIMEIKA